MRVQEPKKLPTGEYYIRLRLGGEYIGVYDTNKKRCKDKAEAIKSAHN